MMVHIMEVASPHAPAARVLVSPSSEVLEGDDVSLTCQTAAEPQDDTIYSWYKNSERLQETPDNVLALPHVTSTAAGSYHCRARSPAGTSVSPAIALRVSCECSLLGLRWREVCCGGMGCD